MGSLLASLCVLLVAAWPVRVALDESGMVMIRARGFDVRLASDLAAEPELCVRVFETLRSDLAMIESRVPADAMAVLRERTTIWIELQGASVPGGMSGRGMVFHPSPFWLRANGLDPARAGGVEIVRARDYLAWREQQPMMILHELAHAYHHLLGIESDDIGGAYATASASGLYDAVRRSGLDERERVRAYALSNATEYFAELSEAFFGRNDFEPFDRGALERLDPAGSSVVKRVWMLDRASILRRAADSVGASGRPEGDAE